MRKKEALHHRFSRRERIILMSFFAAAFVILSLSVFWHLQVFKNSGPIRASKFYREVPDIDFTGMDSAKREIALEEMNRAPCTCGCKMKLAYCRNYDRGCKTSLTLCHEVVERLRVNEGEPRSPESSEQQPTKKEE